MVWFDVGFSPKSKIILRVESFETSILGRGIRVNGRGANWAVLTNWIGRIKQRFGDLLMVQIYLHTVE